MNPSLLPDFAAERGRRRTASRVTSLKKPESPSKIGAGPVSPSAASVAAKTPLRAALANAQPFHMLSSPERVCRRATLHTPAMPTACVSLRRVELHQLAGRDGRGDRPVGDVIDAVLAEAGGVAEPALDFVGQHGRGDEVLAACAPTASPTASTAARLSLGWAGSLHR